MNFENISDKQLALIEQLSRELLDVLRRAKFNDQPVYTELSQLEEESRKERQGRFDKDDQRYTGY